MSISIHWLCIDKLAVRVVSGNYRINTYMYISVTLNRLLGCSSFLSLCPVSCTLYVSRGMKRLISLILNLIHCLFDWCIFFLFYYNYFKVWNQTIVFQTHIKISIYTHLFRGYLKVSAKIDLYIMTSAILNLWPLFTNSTKTNGCSFPTGNVLLFAQSFNYDLVGI